MKNIKKVSLTVVLLIVLFTLAGCGCGCGKINYKTYSDVKKELDKIYVEGADAVNVQKRKDNFVSLTISKTLSIFDSYKNNFVDIVKLTEDGSTEVANKINNAKEVLSTELTTIKNQNYTETEIANYMSVALKTALETVKKESGAYFNPVNNNLDESEYRSIKIDEIKNITLVSFLVEEATKQTNTIVNIEQYDDYLQVLFEQDKKEYLEKLRVFDATIDSDDITVDKNYDTVVVEKSQQVYKIMEDLTKVVAEHAVQPEPIRFVLKDFGDFFGNFFDNFFVYPVGLMLMFFSKICGNMYILGLLITTLIVRTLGWPIYAKTNDMSLKMKLMEPEQAKLQEKYANRKDEESQRMMQMEMMQLYKKYKIGIGGCLMPFLQFPIFMAIYRAITRIPYTDGSAGSADWVSKLNSEVFGVDLFADRSAGTGQLIAIIILVVLVVGTQVLQQLYSTKKQKEQQEKAQENIPAYRRQAVNQSNSMAKQMKMMMWFMTATMGMFVFTSKAGLGVYWLIGNIYAIAQQVINNKTSEKRLEKLREKHNTYR